MRIITLIAAHHERPDDLERVIEQAAVLGPVVVMGTTGDGSLAAVAGNPSVTYNHGVFSRERDKRNALLGLAHAYIEEIGVDDWLLSLDSDETIVGDIAALPMLLARWHAPLPGYPIVRMEPDGSLWAMPSKLLRGDVFRFEYLDVGVRWRSENWNLDPWRFGRGAILPGWPGLLHFRSSRADQAVSDPYYSEQHGMGPQGFRPYPQHFIPQGVIQ